MTIQQFIEALAMIIMSCIACCIWFYVFGVLMAQESFRRLAAGLGFAAYLVFVIFLVAICADAVKIF